MTWEPEDFAMLQSLHDNLQTEETAKRQREEQAEKEAAEKFLDDLLIDPYSSPIPSPTHSPPQADRGKNIAVIPDIRESSHSLSSTGRSNSFPHPAHQTDQHAMPDAPWHSDNDNEELIDDDTPLLVPPHTLATPDDPAINNKGKGIAVDEPIPEPIVPQAERMNFGTPFSPMRQFSPSVTPQDDPKGKALAASSHDTDQTALLQTEAATPTLSGAEASSQSWAPSLIVDTKMDDNVLSAHSMLNPFMRTRSKTRPAENPIARQLFFQPSSPATPKSKRHNTKNSYTDSQKKSFIQFYKKHTHTYANMTQLLQAFSTENFRLPKITGREWLQDAGLLPMQSQKRNVYQGLWPLLSQSGISPQSLKADSDPVETFLDQQVKETGLKRPSLKRWVGHFFRDLQENRLPGVMANILNTPVATLMGSEHSIPRDHINPVSDPRYTVKENSSRVEADRPTALPAGITDTDDQKPLALNPFPSGRHTGKRKVGETSRLTDHPDGLFGKRTKAMPDAP